MPRSHNDNAAHAGNVAHAVNAAHAANAAHAGNAATRSRDDMSAPTAILPLSPIGSNPGVSSSDDPNSGDHAGQTLWLALPPEPADRTTRLHSVDVADGTPGVGAATDPKRAPSRLAAKAGAPDPWGEGLFGTRSALGDPPVAWRRKILVWLIPAVLTAVVSGWDLGRPSLWTDELATAGMATAPWQQFWPVLRFVDAVLAPYYVLIHLWTGLVGSSDVALRIPSAAAMVASAALIGLLGFRLRGFRAGLAAGLVFAVLPAVSRYGQEARPYAFVTLVAVIATYALVAALERPAWQRFAGYALAIVGLGSLHMVAFVLLVAHGWLVFAWRRRLVLPWCAAAFVAVVALAPLLWYGAQQRHQVAYITAVGLTQSGAFLAAMFGSLSVGVAVAVLAAYSLPLRWPSAVATTWALVPTATLVVVSLVAPMLLARYVVFTLPGWALLAGTALARLRIGWLAAGLALIAAVGVPSQLQIRHGDGHGEATRAAADVVATNDRAGDAVVYADNEPGGGWTARDAIDRYVPLDRRPRDVLETRPPRTDGQLLAGECRDVSACLHSAPRIWVVRLGDLTNPLRGLGANKESALKSRYRVSQTWHVRGMTVALLTLDPSGR